jgi:hypothetical protein
LWWTERRWGGFSPSTSVSSASCDSTNCSIFIRHPVIQRYVVLILTVSLNNQLTNIWRGVQIMKQFCPASVFALPNTLLSILFTNTFSLDLGSSLSERDQVSHPYTCKVLTLS